MVDRLTKFKELLEKLQDAAERERTLSRNVTRANQRFLRRYASDVRKLVDLKGNEAAEDFLALPRRSTSNSREARYGIPERGSSQTEESTTAIPTG